jgi:UDP-N-acetyl-D-glucosamine dehydrogenase
VELAGKLNQRMPDFCVTRIVRALNDAGKAVRGARIAILGVSYKPGVGDIRESPALKIMEQLLDQGAELTYHDPHVPEVAQLDMRSEELDEALDDADLVVIVTAHPQVDHEAVAREAPLVVDLRGVTRGVASTSVVRL